MGLRCDDWHRLAYAVLCIYTQRTGEVYIYLVLCILIGWLFSAFGAMMTIHDMCDDDDVGFFGRRRECARGVNELTLFGFWSGSGGGEEANMWFFGCTRFSASLVRCFGSVCVCVCV